MGAAAPAQRGCKVWFRVGIDDLLKAQISLNLQFLVISTVQNNPQNPILLILNPKPGFGFRV